jgi:hypothetical protein
MLERRSSMARFVLISALAAAATALLLAGCGIGEPGAEGKVSETSDKYLRALADGDTVKACAQLTAEARAALDGSCRSAMEALASRVGREALDDAADGGVEIDVDGGRASARIRNLEGARLALVPAGREWLIADGYSLER